ncbi:hypothetical protein [Acaryochloris marina]|nr:hypothetical protein [Acaryochloris marina]
MTTTPKVNQEHPLHTPVIRCTGEHSVKTATSWSETLRLLMSSTQ